ncbi:MAG: hypothetical protein K1X92_11445 [Bacteroidia bacterium]|nr:hypothetical protein [Bacteroidia bacterium]
MTNTIHILSPEALQRYLKGDLSETEKRKVEVVMKQDPFIADAMEGLQAMKNPDLLSEYTPVIDLNPFTETHQENRRQLVGVAMMQYLVAIALLALTWYAFLLIRKIQIQKEKNLQKNTYIVPSGTSAPNDTIHYFHLSPVPEK